MDQELLAMSPTFDKSKKSPEELVLKENVPIRLRNMEQPLIFFMTNDYTVLVEKLKTFSCRAPLPEDFVPTPELPGRVRSKMKSLGATWSFSFDKAGDILNYYDGITEPPFCMSLEKLAQDGKSFPVEKMRWYIEKNKGKEIEKLIKSGYDIKQILYGDIAPVTSAVISNSLDALRTLLEHGANVNERNSMGITPLMVAACMNSYEAAGILLSAKEIDINAKALSGETALLLAAQEKNFEMVILLIASGADLDASDNYSNTALIESVNNRDNTISNHLIDSGANVNLADKNGFTPLIFATLSDNKAMVEKLIKARADINATDRFGCTAILYAAGYNLLELVELFLRTVDVPLNDHILAIHTACKKGYGEVLSALLRDVELKFKDSFPDAANYALAFACQENKDELIPVCMEYGGDINFAPNFGMTLLMESIYTGAIGFAFRLIELGADVNKTDDYGMTALMYAASKNDFTTIQQLQENGADWDIKDKQGKTFTDYCKEVDLRSYSEMFNDRNKEQSGNDDKLSEETFHSHQTFNETFERYIQGYFNRFPSKKLSDIYRDGGISRKTFSKIRSNKNPDYKPKKETAISLALGMKLSEEDAESFLQSAGYKFYDSDKTDAVARELLREGNYNRFDWNEKIYKKTGRVFFNM